MTGAPPAWVTVRADSSVRTRPATSQPFRGRRAGDVPADEAAGAGEGQARHGVSSAGRRRRARPIP